MQVGTPKDIYDKPENLFIATFIGKRALIEGMVDELGDTIRVNIGGSFLEGVNTCNTLEGVIDWSAFVGPRIEVKVTIGESSLMIDAPTDMDYIPGEKLTVYPPKAKTIVLPWLG